MTCVWSNDQSTVSKLWRKTPIPKTWIQVSISLMVLTVLLKSDSLSLFLHLHFVQFYIAFWAKKLQYLATNCNIYALSIYIAVRMWRNNWKFCENINGFFSCLIIITGTSSWLFHQSLYHRISQNFSPNTYVFIGLLNTKFDPQSTVKDLCM